MEVSGGTGLLEAFLCVCEFKVGSLTKMADMLVHQHSGNMVCTQISNCIFKLICNSSRLPQNSFASQKTWP